MDCTPSIEHIQRKNKTYCIKRYTLYYRIRDNLNKKRKEADIKNKIKDITYHHPYYGNRRITDQLRREKVKG